MGEAVPYLPLWKNRHCELLTLAGTTGVDALEEPASGSDGVSKSALFTSPKTVEKKKNTDEILRGGKMQYEIPTYRPKNQILLYPQDNLSPVLCHAPVSRA